MASTMPASTHRRGTLGERLLRLLYPGHVPPPPTSAIKNDWGTPAMSSPLPSMMQAFQTLAERQQQLDQMELEAPADERARIGGWGETNLEALDHLERAIAAVPADDQKGAVVQVLIALERLSALRDRTEGPEQDDELTVLHLLLRSALPALAEGAGVDLASYGGARYAREARDWPFFRTHRPPS